MVNKKEVKIELFDFENEDIDFKDSDKDFGQMQDFNSRSQSRKRPRGLELHPLAVRDDEVALEEWRYDSLLRWEKDRGIYLLNGASNDVIYHPRSNL